MIWSVLDWSSLVAELPRPIHDIDTPVNAAHIRDMCRSSVKHFEEECL